MEGFDPALIGQEEKDFLSSKIKNELNDYFRFSTLLKKKRSVKNTRLIEEYIKMESNIQKRLTFIEELDKESRFEDRVTPSVEKEDIKKAKEKIAEHHKQIERISFFTFFFSSSKPVKSFGTRTRILESKFFGFSIKLTSESEFEYKKILQNATLILLKPINHILNNGWEKLDRQTYNIVETFAQFLNQFVQKGNILDRQDSASIYKGLTSYVEPYLQVVGNKNYKELLKEAFYKVLLFVPAYKQKFRDISALLSEMIDTDSRGMCFFNIILGIMMVRFRQFVKLVDMLDHFNIKEIDNIRYHFSPALIQELNDKLSSLELRYRKAERELFFLKFIEEDFYTKSGLDNPLAKHFIRLYYLDKPDEVNNAGDDFLEITLSNLSDFMSRFIQNYLNCYETVLKDKVKLTSIDKGDVEHEIFRYWIFSGDIQKLKDYQNELQSIQSTGSYLAIQFSVYDNFSNTGKTQIEKEEKICNVVKKIVSTFYSLSEKLSTVLYNHYDVQNLKKDDIFKLSKAQENPIEDITYEPRLVPFATNTLDQHPYLDKRIVMDVLNEIMVISLNLCNLFKYHPLSAKFLEKQKLIDITEEYINIKSKIED